MAKRLEHVEAAKEECRRLGASLEIIQGGRHLIGKICINNQCRKIFLSLTPRDNKVCYVIREDVRRKVREMTC